MRRDHVSVHIHCPWRGPRNSTLPTETLWIRSLFPMFGPTVYPVEGCRVLGVLAAQKRLPTYLFSAAQTPTKEYFWVSLCSYISKRVRDVAVTAFTLPLLVVPSIVFR